MTTILHISDPHFGTVQEPVYRALLKFAHEQSPDIILLTGDITQRARRSQFALAREFIDQLPCPVLKVPGNHDMPLYNLLERWRNPYGNYKAALGEDLEPEFEGAQLLVIGVNSSRAGRHTDGEVSSGQIERVRQRLSAASPDQLRVVMQHHPVRAIEESDLENLLINREEAVPVWVDAGMDILVAGHIHLPYARRLVGSEDRWGWTVQAGTALSHRIRGNVPNSVNVLKRLKSDGAQVGPLQHCILERWDHTYSAGCFECVESSELELYR